MLDKISIITPFFNEEENILSLCKTLDEFALDKKYSIEAIFVDDGSGDNSSSILKAYKFKNISAKLVRLSKNFGSHSAIRAGIKAATNDFCMFFSADLQEPVELIEAMVEEIDKGYDYVCARKKDVQTGIVEKAFSRLYSRLIQRFAVKEFPIGGVNNILFGKKIKENLNKQIESNSSIFLQIIDMGYKMSVIDATYRPRKRGRSKWTFSKRVKLLIDSFVSFSFFPIRMVSVMGIGLFLLGIFIAVITFLVKIFNIIPLTLGWPTLISVVSIGFGITNISLGIMAEYLWRTYDYSRNNAAYLIDEITDIK